MYQVYKISTGQLSAASRRFISKAVKIMVLIYLLVMGYFVWQLQVEWKYVLISAVVCIPAYGLALLIGYKLLKQGYRRYRIVLDDEGVEFDMPPNNKKIKWQNLSKIVKPDGTVELRDKTVSAMMSWLTGEGSILLIPEIEAFDKLLAEIESKYTSP